jgi:FtsZ-binding cell division protein ZapB
MKYIYITTIFCASIFAQTVTEEDTTVKDTIKLSTVSIEKSGLTQEQIVKLDEQTRVLLADYQSTSKEYDSLKLYNDQVQKIINSQIEEIESILQKIDELDKTNQRIVPFMLRMIDGLENFIQLDLPFLQVERKSRLDNLKITMDRGDVSTSEKFRLIIEAYKTELEYGRTIESYRDNILIDGIETSADFLRIGRIALTYLTVDGSKGGYWDTNTSSWEKATSSIKRSTADALKVASKQAPPALIKIPVYRNNDE